MVISAGSGSYSTSMSAEGGGGRLQRLGGHRRHRVAFVPDLVHGQHGRVLHQRAVILLDVS